MVASSPVPLPQGGFYHQYAAEALFNQPYLDARDRLLFTSLDSSYYSKMTPPEVMAKRLHPVRKSGREDSLYRAAQDSAPSIYHQAHANSKLNFQRHYLNRDPEAKNLFVSNFNGGSPQAMEKSLNSHSLQLVKSEASALKKSVYQLQQSTLMSHQKTLEMHNSMKSSRSPKFEVYRPAEHSKYSAFPLPQTNRSHVSIQELDEETGYDDQVIRPSRYKTESRGVSNSSHDNDDGDLVYMTRRVKDLEAELRKTKAENESMQEKIIQMDSEIKGLEELICKEGDIDPHIQGETKIQSEETDKVDSRTKQTEEDNSELIELKKERYREQLEHDRVRDELQAEIDTLNITVQNQEAAILGIKNCYQAQLHSAYVHIDYLDAEVERREEKLTILTTQTREQLVRKDQALNALENEVLSLRAILTEAKCAMNATSYEFLKVANSTCSGSKASESNFKAGLEPRELSCSEDSSQNGVYSLQIKAFNEEEHQEKNANGECDISEEVFRSMRWMNECASKLCSTMVYWKNTAYENQVKAVLLGRALLGAAKYRFLQLMQTENAKLARSNRMVNFLRSNIHKLKGKNSDLEGKVRQHVQAIKTFKSAIGVEKENVQKIFNKQQSIIKFGKATVNRLEGELTQFQEQMSKTQEELQESINKEQEANLKLNRSQNEARKLESELLARRKEFEGITERIKTSSRAAEEMTKQMQDLRDEAQTKEAELESLRRKVKQLEVANEELRENAERAEKAVVLAREKVQKAEGSLQTWIKRKTLKKKK